VEQGLSDARRYASAAGYRRAVVDDLTALEYWLSTAEGPSLPPRARPLPYVHATSSFRVLHYGKWNGGIDRRRPKGGAIGVAVLCFHTGGETFEA